MLLFLGQFSWARRQDGVGDVPRVSQLTTAASCEGGEVGLVVGWQRELCGCRTFHIELLDFTVRSLQPTPRGVLLLSESLPNATREMVFCSSLNVLWTLG